ncbi:MAG: hypothetical protein IJC66_05655, partial [Kiritimatiellae bacterium]|nr:hypothetical protein [Kiritimatiellia bacterium]
VIASVQSPTEIFWTFKEYAGRITNTFIYPQGILASDASKAVGQLDDLVATGGGDLPESLLDAMHAVISAPKSDRGVEDPGMWRERHEAARALIVFTDAPYKPVMVAPGCRNGNWEDIRNLCVQEKILLTLVAPTSELPGYEGFDFLGGINKANYLPIPPGSSGDDSMLDKFLNNKETLQKAIQAIAKTLSKTMTDVL